MRAVGTNQPRDRLFHYLQLVQLGARFVVTARGSPSAGLCPLEVTRTRAAQARAWAEAAARGLVTLPRGRGFGRFRPVRLRSGVKVSDAELEDRR